MNTGLQDAYNLAWKLALVVSGRAGAALLDSYEDERIPVAQRLLSTTDRAFSLIVSDNWLAGLFRTRILARIMAFAMSLDRSPKARIPHHLPDRHSLPRQPVCRKRWPGLPDAAPRAGDRFPWLRLKLLPDGPVEDLFAKLDDTRFNLIVIGQPAPAGGAAGPRRPAAHPRDSRAIPPTTGSSRARGIPGPPSTSCVPTAMSGLPGFTWKPRRRPVTSPSACTLELRACERWQRRDRPSEPLAQQRHRVRGIVQACTRVRPTLEAPSYVPMNRAPRCR